MPRGDVKFELILLFGRLKLDADKMSDWLKAKGLKYNSYVVDRYYRYYLEAERRVNEMTSNAGG